MKSGMVITFEPEESKTNLTESSKSIAQDEWILFVFFKAKQCQSSLKPVKVIVAYDEDGKFKDPVFCFVLLRQELQILEVENSS